jgi:hypothetical protein
MIEVLCDPGTAQEAAVRRLKNHVIPISVKTQDQQSKTFTKRYVNRDIIEYESRLERLLDHVGNC